MIYHETEHGTIHCGDSLDVLKDMADESVDCCITSPPYDNLRNYKGYSFDFEGIANQLFRVIKQGGVIVWIVGDATVNGSETGTSGASTVKSCPEKTTLEQMKQEMRKHIKSCPEKNRILKEQENQ